MAQTGEEQTRSPLNPESSNASNGAMTPLLAQQSPVRTFISDYQPVVSTPPRAPSSSSRPLPTPTAKALSFSPKLSGRDWSPSSPGIQATIERSDTISSIRSLDRVGFPSPSKRPLPRPPVTVNTSKSLDRGTIGTASQSPRKRFDRKQPSVVLEEDQDEESSEPTPTKPTATAPGPSMSEVNGFAGIPVIHVRDNELEEMFTHSSTAGSATPSIPLIVIAGEAEQEPASLPSIQLNTPALNLPEDDQNDEPQVEADLTSGIIFSGPPIIAVSMGHSDDQSSASSPISRTSTVVREGAAQVHPTQAIICTGCRLPIIGRIVNAMGQRFHPACFKCDQCGDLLEHVSSFEWEGRAYCHLDYHDVSIWSIPVFSRS